MTQCPMDIALAGGVQTFENLFTFHAKTHNNALPSTPSISHTQNVLLIRPSPPPTRLPRRHRRHRRRLLPLSHSTRSSLPPLPLTPPLPYPPLSPLCLPLLSLRPRRISLPALSRRLVLRPRALHQTSPPRRRPSRLPLESTRPRRRRR